MTILAKGAAVVFGAGLLAFSGAASARIICNDDGDCWHSHTEWRVAPGLHLTVHPDTWRWAKTEHYRWHEHDGPGYWEHNEWHSVE